MIVRFYVPNVMIAARAEGEEDKDITRARMRIGCAVCGPGGEVGGRGRGWDRGGRGAGARVFRQLLRGGMREGGGKKEERKRGEGGREGKGW